MSCCGSGRAALRRESVPSSVSESRAWISGPLEFEYTGSGDLSVTGPLTGMIYRFSGQGARIRVHGADVASLVSVPGLRRAG